LEYLIGEKLFTFVTASEQDPNLPQNYRRLSPKFRRLFAPGEIPEYLNHLEQTKFWLRWSLI